MRLVKLPHFRDMVFAQGSAPSLNTLRAQIRKGEIPGGRIQVGHFYVDMDQFDAATGLREGIAARQAQLEGHPLMAGLV